MKLCRLHFKNLNSLAGEWTVNFEESAFASGLFAITGPTGAGKTTLLDAFCLSLFGCTPRLSRVNASGNEIMTRGTAECFAESEFICGKERYCAFWSQKKTRRRDGTEKLQAPKCRFSRLSPDEETLADSVSTMATAVERVCRLDFERFTRTVVLPQGGFAAFLQAGGAERAKILEELTGAEVYRDISRKVFEINRNEKVKLEQLQQALGERPVLSDADRAAVEQRVAESSAKEKELRDEDKRLRSAREWYARHDELEESLAALRREQAENAAAIQAFAPDAARLELAERAKTFDDLYAELSRIREKLKAARDDESAAQKSVKACAAEAEAAARALNDANEAAEAARRRAEQGADLWTKVGKIDRDLAALEKELDAAEKKAQKSADACAKYENEESSLRAKLKAAESRRDTLGKEAEAAAQALEEARAAEGRASLGVLREQLVEGKPCPLCGALHHPAPYSGSDGKERDRLREAAAKARAAEHEAADRLRAAREEIVRLGTELKSCRERLDEAHPQRGTDREEADRLRDERDRLRARRAEKGGDKDPDAEMKRLTDESGEAAKLCGTARDRVEAAKVANAKAEAQREQLEKQISALAKESEERRRDFDGRLTEHGFSDEDEWRAAAMPAGERAQLAAKWDALGKRERKLATLVPQKQEELDACGQPPAVERDGIDGRIGECEDRLAKLLTGLGGDKAALERDDENRARRAELTTEVEKQKSVCAVWSELCDHIGSSKGDVFSRYVQGLTFRRLVRAANAQLEGLSDRYRLRPAQDDALALDVVDLWQGGAVRSAKNLSGGESFIVSLALALALSHGMREVRVGSLFLDEGFGTLDEDALETVLECLNRLREKGRLVGVISHVKLLQERIDCRIAVLPAGNGRSRLSGPGCSRG